MGRRHDPSSPAPRQSRAWRVIAGMFVGLISLLRWRIEVRGLEHVPETGGAVLAFNHHSYVDFVLVAWPIHRQLRREIRFLAKREIWRSPWIGWLARAVNAVPVDRGSAGSRHRAYDAAVDALGSGDLVAVAPEQTVSPSFELLPFRTGAARMAVRAGVPIVPVVGWGTQRLATKRHPSSRSRTWSLAIGIPVVVEYGEPLLPVRDADPREVTRALQERMTVMLDRIQRDYPDRPTPGDDWWVPARLGGSAPSHADVLADHRAREARWEEATRAAAEQHVEERDATP